MTFTPKPFQSPAPHISRADTPLSTLEQQVRETVARQREQRAEASAQRLRDLLAVQPRHPANPGEAAELRHLLYDADPDSTAPAFPYPNAKETP